MKIIHVSHSDSIGGAARAAFRISKALQTRGVDSSMMVNRAQTGDWTVSGPMSRVSRLSALVRPQLAASLTKLMKTENRILHSPAIFPSQWRRILNESDADILNLHWVNGETLSVADIGALRKPIVWTLHDMWGFCGAEHVTADRRWIDGYRRDNRPQNETGFDLNRWTWNRKRKNWKHPISIVAPSRWLAECVRSSALMGDWPVTVIPNPIDTDYWTPIDQETARSIMKLPAGVPLLLFGAIGGRADPNKGFDLLVEALSRLRGQVPGLELVIFGEQAPATDPHLGFPVHYTGHLFDDVSLKIVISCADLLVIPSRCENLPNTAIEAMSCGIPVVAFNTGGIPDIVSHRENGFLADRFDVEHLAQGIKESLTRFRGDLVIRDEIRRSCVEKYSSKVLSGAYLDLYEKMLSGSRCLPSHR